MNCLVIGKKDLELIRRCNNCFDEVDVLESGITARNRLSNVDYDCIIIKTPLKNEFGDMLAKYAANKKMSAVILLVSSHVEELAESMEEYGVIVRSFFIEEDDWKQMIRWIKMMKSKLSFFKEEQNDLEKKIKELKLVNQAKCLLIERYHYTEEKAHKAIEKKAMDNRMSKIDVANVIIQHIKKETIK